MHKIKFISNLKFGVSDVYNHNVKGMKKVMFAYLNKLKLALFIGVLTNLFESRTVAVGLEPVRCVWSGMPIFLLLISSSCIL